MASEGKEMVLLDTIPQGPRATSSLFSRTVPLAHPNEQLKVLDTADIAGGPTGSGQFELDLASCGWPRLMPDRLEIVQINLGKLCNMTCRHCHVDAGPDRTEENMNRDTVDACLEVIDQSGAQVVDLTGGAPELNPNFAYLVEMCVQRGLRVLDRCNLTILLTRRCAHLPVWFAERGVEVICSLPHYRKMGTDAQRGDGTYQKSIEALKRLNRAGYGKGDPNCKLTLVTNPVGAFLSGNQSSLETEWKAALIRNHGVSFDQLLTLNNLPISRYLEWLVETGQVELYLNRLLQAFNASTIAGLMCRNTLSIGWDGYLYDCDFNQQLEMRMDIARPHVRNFDLVAWQNHEIRTARHCYGCTAGAGSGCGGAIT